MQCDCRLCRLVLFGKSQDNEHLSCNRQKGQKPCVQVQDKMVDGDPVAGPGYCGIPYLPDSDGDSDEV